MGLRSVALATELWGLGSVYGPSALRSHQSVLVKADNIKTDLEYHIGMRLRTSYENVEWEQAGWLGGCW